MPPNRPVETLRIRKESRSDKRFFLKHGFEVCDTAPPYFELLVYMNKPEAVTPSFCPSVKDNQCKQREGFTVYYSSQCPYTDYYVNEVLRDLTAKAGFGLEIVHVESAADIRELPSAFSTYRVFFKGRFVTHEILSESKFNKIMEELRSQ